jgi:uncharacterized protein YjlB
MMKTIAEVLRDDGTFPNSALPLVAFQRAFDPAGGNLARRIEEVFAANGWGGGWRNGIYGFHHYHSSAHEALGVYRGSARVQLGGEQGITVSIAAGDVVVIPAGVAHKNLGASRDFAVVGAYPDGQRLDMNYGKAAERPGADERIAQVALPRMDPVHGAGGPLLGLWRSARPGKP